MVIGSDGLDALTGLPLAALTASPALVRRATAMLGPDRLDAYARPTG
jgi:hypothetical protein